MHGVQAISDPWVHVSHHPLPATELKAGMVVQITETDMYRDENDTLVYSDQTWQAQVLSVEFMWNAPSEVFVSFYDGPGAWVLRDANVPVVSGPLNSSGRF